MSNLKPFAFILMPFDKKFEDIYKFGIKATAEELGVVAERVDEQHFSETILERVYRQIENSDLIIAEMTGRNPNVFYEVGYAHAKGKLCSLITQSARDIPFDLKHHPHVIYDGSIADLKAQLAPKIEWMKLEVAKKHLETITVKAKAGTAFLEKNEHIHRGKFDLIIDLNNNSTRRSPEIDAIYIKARKIWTLKFKGSICPSNIDEAGKIKTSLVHPSLKRLSPGAFSQERVSLEGTLWNKFSGDEQREIYTMKGALEIDIVTSEGTFVHELPIEVTFEDFPF